VEATNVGANAGQMLENVIVDHGFTECASSLLCLDNFLVYIDSFWRLWSLGYRLGQDRWPCEPHRGCEFSCGSTT